MYAVKFDSLEKREAFRKFCDYIGWNFGMLIGAENGWWVDNDSGSKDDTEQMNYLHSLGAFQWYHE